MSEPSPGVTEYVRVPVEATEEQLDAVTPAASEWIGHPEAKPDSIERWRQGHREAARKNYRLMVAAAPVPSPEGMALETTARALIAKLRLPLPVCPFDERSPDYWKEIKPEQPCPVCGGLGTTDSENKCRGADTTCMSEAADTIDRLLSEVGRLTQDRDDYKADYFRRHKEAVDLYEENLSLRSQLDAANARAAELLDAERKLSDAYVRLRAILKDYGAFNTPHAPTGPQIWETTETAAKAVVARAEAAERERDANHHLAVANGARAREEYERAEALASDLGKAQERIAEGERVMQPFARMADVAGYYIEACCPEMSWPQNSKIDPDGPSRAIVGTPDMMAVRAFLAKPQAPEDGGTQ